MFVKFWWQLVEAKIKRLKLKKRTSFQELNNILFFIRLFLTLSRDSNDFQCRSKTFEVFTFWSNFERIR